MPYLDGPDCRLYYETEGQGPALIFAHGLGGNPLSWWQQVPSFRDRYTCVTFAHRGFSPSESGPDTTGPFGFVDDLAALVDPLRLPDVRLVAQSMGGWTCLGYALREPWRVRALVMACTVGTVTHPDIDRALAAPPGNPGGPGRSGAAQHLPRRGRDDGSRAAGASVSLPGDRAAPRGARHG